MPTVLCFVLYPSIILYLDRALVGVVHSLRRLHGFRYTYGRGELWTDNSFGACRVLDFRAVDFEIEHVVALERIEPIIHHQGKNRMLPALFPAGFVGAHRARLSSPLLQLRMV